MEEVVVTGIRGSVERAQAVKRLAPSVVEAVTFEDLGKFSDNNIADALQRVPGVQIERNDSSINGDRASVRGLGPAYVAVTVNGRVPLTGGDEGVQSLRQINLDVVPTELVAGILVYKTPTAELVESGLGGEVEMQTLKPLSYKPPSGKNTYGSVTVRDGYDNQAKAWTPRVSGVLGGKFFDRTLGVFVSGLYAKGDIRNDEVFNRFAFRDLSFDDNSDGKADRTLKDVIVPTSTTISKNTGTSKKEGYATGFQWQPNERLEIGGDVTYSGGFVHQYRSYGAVQWNQAASVFAGVARPGGYEVDAQNILVALDTSKLSYANGIVNPVAFSSQPLKYFNNQQAWVGGINGAYHGDNWNLKADWGHSKGKFLQDLRFVSNAPRPPNFNVVFDGRGDAPLITGVNNLLPAAGIGTPNFLARNYLNAMSADSARVDFDIEVKPWLTLKAGARYQETKIAISQRAYSAVAGTATGLPYGFTLDKAIALTSALYPGGSANFLNKQDFQVNLPEMSLTSGLAVIPQLRDLQLTKANEDLAFGFGSQEKTSALYVQGDFNGAAGAIPFEGNFGVRAVYTDLYSNAYQTVTLTAGAGRIVSQQATPISDTNKYWRYLPSANLTLHPISNVNLRFGVSRVMTRPEYESTAPKNTITIFDRTDPLIDPTQLDTAATGNTKLRPMTAWQYDTTVEYYTANRGAYYVSGYYKDISDFILRGVVQRNVTVLGQGSRLFNSTSTINVSKGKVYGFELGLDQPLTFLPDMFDGLGVQANYTYVKSSLDSDNPQLAFGVPGASKHNFNGVVYYEKGPFSTRLAYAYRSDFFQQLGGGVDRATQPTFTKGYGTLDASMTYKVTPHFEVTVSGSNLTKENRRDFLIDPDVFRSFIQRSSVYSLTLRAIL